MKLSEFLRARIEEEQASARSAFNGVHDDGVWAVEGGEWDRDIRGAGIRIYDEGGHDHEQAVHIAAHDPARVLRDCGARLTMLDLAAASRPALDVRGHMVAAGMELMLILLASAYADHPDYRAAAEEGL